MQLGFVSATVVRLAAPRSRRRRSSRWEWNAADEVEDDVGRHKEGDDEHDRCGGVRTRHGAQPRQKPSAACGTMKRDVLRAESSPSARDATPRVA